MSAEITTRAQVVALRAEGLRYREIAQRLGLSYTTVRNYGSDPDRSKDKARRLSYAGTCEICGKRTDGSNGLAAAPKRCVQHNLGGFKQRGRGDKVSLALALLDERPMRYTELSEALGFPRKTDVGQLLHRLLKYGLVERVSRGLYVRVREADAQERQAA